MPSALRPRNLLGHLILGLTALACVFPVYWMIVTALRPETQVYSSSPLPWPLTLANFDYVRRTIPIGTMLANTFFMAAAQAVSQILVGLLAAYALTRWTFVGRQLIFGLFVGSWLVPFQVTMIPNYLLISQLDLLNTVAGAIVPNLCSAFAVLLLRQHLAGFPRELLDAAEMDGLNSWSTLWRVVVPNMKPALAALTIMLFITAWNEYLWPALVMQQSNVVVQMGIRSFLGAEGDNWGAVMAAAVLACLPILLIYLFLRRFVVDAFVRSGLK